MVSFDVLQNLQNKFRSQEDNLNIYEWLIRKTEIFKKLTLNTVIEILDNGKLIEKQCNELIIRQGDYGDCFYVMMKGSASIYINTDLNISQQEDQIESINLRKSLKSASIKKMQKEAMKPVKNNDRKLLGEFVGKYVEGSCFGELALLQKECIRNASIISDENVYILSINRDLFNNSLRSFTETLYQEKINFVNSCFLFKNWMPRLKYQIAMSLSKESFSFDQHIIVQGQESNGLIFLKKGQAKAILDIKMQNNQFNTLIVDQFNEHLTNDLLSKVNSSDSSSNSKINQFKKEVMKNIKTDVYEVAILGENYIIGDIEYCFDIGSNLFTVIAVENCEVYILSQANLDRMINTKHNATTFNIIQNLATSKLNIYYNRCSVISNLPLFKYILEETEKLAEDNVSSIHKTSIKINFKPIFPPGPIIDFFGPGSVFFRNRSKRQAMEAKQHRIEQSEKNNRWKNKTQFPSLSKTNTKYSQADLSKSFSSFLLKDKEQKMIDWETSSEHLQNLEGRLNSWMKNIPVQNSPFSRLTNEFTILKLQRFKTEMPPKNFRVLKMKDKKENDIDTIDGFNKRTNKEKPKDQKIIEPMIRQYTEVDYRLLKKEMLIKEKKLAVFRLLNSI